MKNVTLERLGKFLQANAVVITLAIVPPITIWYFIQRDRRELDVVVEASVPVVSIEEQFADGIAIHLNNKRISSLYVVDTQVCNAGNRPIDRSDFDTPLTLLFSGTVIPPVELIKTDPPNLPVQVSVAGKKVVVEPMLLNRGDRFVLRARVTDVVEGELTVGANARIKGIARIEAKTETDKRPWRPFVSGALSSLLAAISLAAIIQLARRARGLTVSIPGFAKFELWSSGGKEETSKRISELADRLEIARHDFKSNLLLLRLKIESQLRELARAADLGQRDQLGSMRSISRKLEQRGLLSHQIAALIRDISPIMNRELHESGSYLTEAEFAELQRAALLVVAAIESDSAQSKQSS